MDPPTASRLADSHSTQPLPRPVRPQGLAPDAFCFPKLPSLTCEGAIPGNHKSHRSSRQLPWVQGSGLWPSSPAGLPQLQDTEQASRMQRRKMKRQQNKGRTEKSGTASPDPTRAFSTSLPGLRGQTRSEPEPRSGGHLLRGLSAGVHSSREPGGGGRAPAASSQGNVSGVRPRAGCRLSETHTKGDLTRWVQRLP